MPKGSLRVALYARVSSDKQHKDGTIASQVEALRQRIRDDGEVLDEALCFVDDGCSGSTLIRPALERLRDQVAAGTIDRIYVATPDRLSRHYAYQVVLVDEWRRAGVELVFLRQDLGRTPEQALLLQVQGMMAEYERAQILERSRRGKLHAARRGSVSVFSQAPYGYRYVRRGEGLGEARYQIVAAEARVVQQIFTWVGQEGCSLSEVQRRLQRQGLGPRGGQAAWSRTSLWVILKNPAYQGRAAYGKTRRGERRRRLRPARGQLEPPRRPGSVYATSAAEQIVVPVPALVSADLFAAVQERLLENRRRQHQVASGARHLLQGLVVCQQCGYAFCGQRPGSPRAYGYYRCIGADRTRFGGQRCCWNKAVPADLLETAVWKDVCQLLRHPQRLADEYQRRLQRAPQEQARASQQLAALVGKVQQGKARLLDAYQDGYLDKAELAMRMQEVNQRLANLQAEVKTQAARQTQEQELRLVITRLEDFAQRVVQGLQSADWNSRQEIIRTLVKRIEINHDDVRIVYRIDPQDARSPAAPILQDRSRRLCAFG
jgi:site-specific DNA recombinase